MVWGRETAAVTDVGSRMSNWNKRMMGKNPQGWQWNITHLFEPLHVFEVESNIKKAEIRIYKLKLQWKEKEGWFIKSFEVTETQIMS